MTFDGIYAEYCKMVFNLALQVVQYEKSIQIHIQSSRSNETPPRGKNKKGAAPCGTAPFLRYELNEQSLSFNYLL
jgi:hypothetical protein